METLQSPRENITLRFQTFSIISPQGDGNGIVRQGGHLKKNRTFSIISPQGDGNKPPGASSLKILASFLFQSFPRKGMETATSVVAGKEV